jgi:general secretion pathway protein G
MKNNTKQRTLARGFTLLEIIVVVTIIAVLATLIAPKLLSRVGSAKQTAAIAKASTIAKAINLYLLDEGISSPDDNFDLEILLLSPDDGGGSHGPYLERSADIVDPWGVPYELIVPGDVNASFDVISWGEDKQPGGEGSAVDITQ